MARLPAAEWTQRKSLAALVASLGRDNIRWVGGAVRDTLAGRPVADVDAATPLRPEEVIRRLGEAGIRTVPTGIDHGTVTALFDDGNVEITTLRRDVSTDGRRATIAFADDWREDAARRLASFASAMIEQRTSGVTLDLARLGEAGERAPRPPQVRQRLVERGS